MDGLEVVGRVRALGNEHPPYIIMLTIKGEKVDIITGLDTGADDYKEGGQIFDWLICNIAFFSYPVNPVDPVEVLRSVLWENI